MTESEWLASDCDHLMYEFIRRPADRRKLRLFACACCRRIWDLLTDERSRAAVEVSERYADGRATKQELSAAQAGAHLAWKAAEEELRPLQQMGLHGFKGLSPEEKVAAIAREFAAARRFYAASAAKAAARPTDRPRLMAEEMGGARGGALFAAIVGQPRPVFLSHRSAQSGLLRCVFGNPFRPQGIAAACRPADVVRLAGEIYEDRAFDRLPALADAIEQAGCSDPDAPAHCRGPGPHARGCWVLDAILAR